MTQVRLKTNGYPVMGETNPLHNNVYGPMQPGFGMPPPDSHQAPRGPYPPTAGRLCSCPMAYPQMPYPQMPYLQIPYPQMPYPQMPYLQMPNLQMSYPQMPYPQGPYKGPGQPGFLGDPAAPDSDPGYHGNDSINSTFEYKSIRRAFIRKVFMVFTVQLLVTSAVAVFTFGVDPELFVWSDQWTYSVYISNVVFLICLNVLSCCSFLPQAPLEPGDPGEERTSPNIKPLSPPNSLFSFSPF
ncbi:protein lifeguard 1-like [Dunckerocampus dactyliophorus]|uniref:protein lifeguard 1-like n=1 Tax=Dunckerocampus dactyliophorus TaxID=161453 RepID=UPI00240598D4|nr:protein lifeguard 1-like [Dunckerocampus dactyliophorus]